jgi:hypothetical protein
MSESAASEKLKESAGGAPRLYGEELVSELRRPVGQLGWRAGVIL